MMEQWLDRLRGEEAASALSELVAMAKKPAVRTEIDALLTDRTLIYSLIKDPKPKARKNAARLLGALERPGDADALADALATEETLLVVPSILLALGACAARGSRPLRAKALAAVEGYAVPTDAEEKHRLEIEAARRKAVSSLGDKQAFKPLASFAAPREVLLTPPLGFEGVLAKELQELGYVPRPAKGGVTVDTRDAAGLMRARCCYELLLPLAGELPCSPESVAEAAKGALTGPYRVELRDYPGDRGAFIQALVTLLGGRNDPSHYETELRVQCRGERAEVFLKPMTIPDGRFSYRKQAIPASMHPATAAAVVRYTAQFRRDGAQLPAVLDPFCGSGTLLLEREKLSPCRALIGVDISLTAINAARVNGRAAGSRAQFVQKDCLRFAPKGTFDEVYANLPFGNRVGTHESNEALYASFLRRLPGLLSPGGIAALYTMEYRLLDRLAKGEKRLKRLSQTRTEAGGLTPWLLVFRLEG